MKCISCGYGSLKNFLKVPGAPMCVQVITGAHIKKDKKINLEILICEKCTLVQLSNKNYLKEGYYDDYIMSRTHSHFSKNYQTSLAKDFVETFNLKNKSIVDVGCGDGYFALALMRQKAKVLGIEPSDVACDSARQKGVKVIRGYVDDKFRLKGKMDAFVTCQVFEHISDPGKLLKNIKKFLKEDAYGLIEVPSVVKAIHDNRYYDFFPDHVAYFSPTSLSYLAQASGFDVISVKHTANDEYITAYLRLAKNSGLPKDFQKTFTSYKTEFRNFFDKLKNKKVAVWGAGAKGVSSISFSGIDVSNISFCVDSDPNKLGRFLPGSHIKIVSPESLHKNKQDVIVVTAMMYKDEIVSTLRKKFGYKKSQIAVIAPKPMFIG